MLGYFAIGLFWPSGWVKCLTFWVLTQPLGQNNPIAGFVHISPSTGLYLTHHFLDCTSGFWCERQQEMDFFTGGSVIMGYEVVFWAWWICFLQKRSFCLLQMLTDGLEWCGLLWCFYQLFGLSFWRHPFTAEHPLLRHWCNATFSKSDEETNSSRVNVHQLFL